MVIAVLHLCEHRYEHRGRTGTAAPPEPTGAGGVAEGAHDGLVVGVVCGAAVGPGGDGAGVTMVFHSGGAVPLAVGVSPMTGGWMASPVRG